MRDLANKMAELKFEAPLAQFEETDEWGPIDYQSSTNPNANTTNLKELSLNLKENDTKNILILGDLINNHHNNLANHNNQDEDSMLANDFNESFGSGTNNGGQIKNDSPNCNSNAAKTNAIILAAATNGKGDTHEINFTETISASLEDLVNTFDDKITKCFGNYEESVEELAPVQVRTQEEIMNECQPNILSSRENILSSRDHNALDRESFDALSQYQPNIDGDFSVQYSNQCKIKFIEFNDQIHPRMWWTITGNFGNILPIDWSKSHSRQMHMPTLNLGRRPAETPDDDINDLSSEDEAVANDLDMHTLILGGLHTENEPIKTAEEVMKEIDDIMDEATPSEDDVIVSEAMEKAKEVLGSPLYEDKLRALSIGQLNELYMEMEVLIREFSETLISELALRDEFEYEKELKNTFISLLLAVQNRRRQYHVEKKRGKQKGGKQPSGMDPKYLTTVIPYSLDSGTPDNQTLQILIKILKAINEDNPTVPTLLTDYILKVLCPT